METITVFWICLKIYQNEILCAGFGKSALAQFLVSFKIAFIFFWEKMNEHQRPYETDKI